MQKNYLIIGAVIIGILVIITGGFFFFNQSQSNDNIIIGDSTNNEKINENLEIKEDKIIAKDSNYLEYSNTALDETSNSKRVLFFYANWCPTCRPTDTELKNNQSQIPQNLKVIRVNFNDPETDDEENELASKFGVSSQHTFVQIDENGNAITKWNGGGLDELLEKVQ